MQHGQNRGFETGDIAALRHFVDVKVVGQGTEGDAGSRHLGSIAPGESDDALLPPGRTVRKGAITLISNLDRLASPRGRRQPVKAEAAKRWRGTLQP